MVIPCICNYLQFTLVQYNIIWIYMYLVIGSCNRSSTGSHTTSLGYRPGRDMEKAQTHPRCMAQEIWCISLDTICSSHMQNHIMSMTTSSDRHRTVRMLSQRQILIEIIFAIKLYLQLSVLHYANGTSCIASICLDLSVGHKCLNFKITLNRHIHSKI